MTATAEYRVPLGLSSLAIRTEYRHDESTGPQGGFYNAARMTPALVPGQNLFFVSLLWSYDGADGL